MVLMLVRAIYWSICQLDWLIVTVFRFDLTVPEHDNFVLEKMLSPNVVVSWVPVRLSHGDRTVNNCEAAACQCQFIFCCNCCDDLGTCFLP